MNLIYSRQSLALMAGSNLKPRKYYHSNHGAIKGWGHKFGQVGLTADAQHYTTHLLHEMPTLQSTLGYPYQTYGFSRFRSYLFVYLFKYI